MAPLLSRRYPRTFHLAVALLLAGLLAGGLIGLLGAGRGGPAWVAGWLVGLNVVTFAYYGYDKGQASRGGRRVPEAVLHALAALGGSPAALLAMRLLRHKTIARPFRILFWCIVVLQVLLTAWVVKLLAAA